MLKKAFLLFTAALQLSASLAEARPQRCEGLFEDSLEKVFEQIDAQSQGRLFNGKGLEDFTAELSWNRRRKIRKYLQHTSISQIASEKALEQEVLTLGNLMFGRLDTVDRWLMKTEADRQAQSAEVLARRELIRDGLVKMWGNSHDPQQISRFKKVMDALWRFQTSRVGNLLMFPIFLPAIKDQAMPHDLMFGILRDGYQAHAAEARAFLKAQNDTEAYNRFRRLYTPIFLGTVFIIMYNIAHQEIEQKQAAEVQNFVTELQAIQKWAQDSRAAILEKAWQETRAEFIAKWGEPPTPEEEAILKAQIEREVFKKNLSDKSN